MRYACKRDLHDRCNAGWCDCPCHREAPPTSQELRAQRAAIEAEAAKLRQLYDALDDHEKVTGGGDG